MTPDMPGYGIKTEPDPDPVAEEREEVRERLHGIAYEIEEQVKHSHEFPFTDEDAQAIWYALEYLIE